MRAVTGQLEGWHEITDGQGDTYTLTATPLYGRPFTMKIEARDSGWGRGRGTYRVARSDGATLSRHVTFEAALRASHRRAKTYLHQRRAPFGIQKLTAAM